MPVNDKIRFVDYNDIRNKVIGILGSGFGNSGYGQPIRSVALTESNKVGVNDWQNLYYDIYNAHLHQNGSAPTNFNIVETETVRYASNKPNFEYNTLADALITNKFNVGTGQSATTSLGSTTQSWPGPYGSFWTALAQATITISFTSAAQARYFFNSGGQIRFTASRSAGTVSQQNTSWTNLLNSVSSINGGAGPTFGGNNPGTGIDPNDGQNYYRLSNAYSAWYTASASSPYGTNFFRIFARSPNVGDNSNGTDSQVQFLFYWSDNYVDPGNTGPQGTYPGDNPNTIDRVDGVIVLSASTFYSTGTLVPAGAGSFTIENPTASFGAISS